MSSFSYTPILRRSVTAACLCEPEVFESGIIRGASVKYNDSAALRLRRRALVKWQPGSPSKVLIVKKPKEPEASAKLREIGNWLMARGIEVYVERVVWASEFKEFKVFEPRTHRNDIDFCITLGGDGTVLYMVSLFEEDEPLPPVLCFAMGSLGFLTPFDAAHFASTLERVLDTSSQPLFCTLRTRKRCEVVYNGQLEAVHHVLNECVLDRGAFPGAVLLEIFVDDSYVTNVEADGLIISTPSGSTAYSLSAGGPVIAPSVPCTVFTPIAPLSLSFRPVVIPESSSICVHLPTCARSHARASFDGKKPMRVRRGTSLFFTTSLCPLPQISLGRMDTDWYEGITSKLKWNQAIRQLPTCPSPVGAKQQELCSARYADRTAAEKALAAAEYCPIVDGDDEHLLEAAAAAATAAAHPPMPRRRGGASGSGSGAASHSRLSELGRRGPSNSGVPRHRIGSNLNLIEDSSRDVGDGSITDSMTNSLEDPEEAAAAAAVVKATVAVTVAAAALAAASTPLRPSLPVAPSGGSASASASGPRPSRMAKAHSHQSFAHTHGHGQEKGPGPGTGGQGHGHEHGHGGHGHGHGHEPGAGAGGAAHSPAQAPGGGGGAGGGRGGGGPRGGNRGFSAGDLTAMSGKVGGSPLGPAGCGAQAAGQQHGGQGGQGRHGGQGGHHHGGRGKGGGGGGGGGRQAVHGSGGGGGGSGGVAGGSSGGGAGASGGVSHPERHPAGVPDPGRTRHLS